MTDPTSILKQAVTQITDTINNQGLAPEAAVTKVAKELNLNHNFIKRASEAINVALTYNHFKKHADCRDMDFPIVDAQNVIKEIYGKEAATINEQKSAMFTGVNIEEDVPNFNRYSEPQYKKAYLEILNTKESNSSFPISEEGAIKKAFGVLDSIQHKMDIAKVEATELKQASLKKFADLTNYWSRGEEYRESFSEFESQAFSKFGEAAIPYVDALYKRAGIKEERGQHDSKYIMFDSCEALTKLSAFADANDKYEVKQAEYVKLASAYVEIKENLDKFAKAKIKDKFKFFPKDEQEEIGKEPAETKDGEPAHEDKETPEKEKEEKAEGDDDPVKDYIKKKALEITVPADLQLDDEIRLLTPGQRTLPGSLKAKIIAKKKYLAMQPKIAGNLLVDQFLSKYKGEGQPGSSVPSVSPLDNLDRKLLLQELIGTDPILKTYEPKQIGDAYQQFLRLAPEMSLEKEVVRSYLRQASATQSLSPFDAAQLVDTNTKLMKQKQLGEGRKVEQERN